MKLRRHLRRKETWMLHAHRYVHMRIDRRYAQRSLLMPVPGKRAHRPFTPGPCSLPGGARKFSPPTDDSRLKMRPLRSATVNSRTDPDELREMHLRKLRAGLADVLKTNAFLRSRLTEVNGWGDFE